MFLKTKRTQATKAVNVGLKTKAVIQNTGLATSIRKEQDGNRIQAKESSKEFLKQRRPWRTYSQ